MIRMGKTPHLARAFVVVACPPMKPLMKVAMRNIPVSVPVAWVDFYDIQADGMGMTRNATFRLALKLAGPIIERLRKLLKVQLLAALNDPCWASEILAPPALLPGPVILVADERRAKSTATAGPRPTEKPGGGQKIIGNPGREKARAGCHTGKGNPGNSGQRFPITSGKGNPGKRA